MDETKESKPIVYMRIYTYAQHRTEQRQRHTSSCHAAGVEKVEKEAKKGRCIGLITGKEEKSFRSSAVLLDFLLLLHRHILPLVLTLFIRTPKRIPLAILCVHRMATQAKAI